VFDETWWQKQNTAEALHGQPETFSSTEDIKNRILNMSLTYLKPTEGIGGAKGAEAML